MRGQRRVQKGEVVRVGTEKTAVVIIRGRKRHPKYGKIINESKKYQVHCEIPDVAVGQIVEIVSCRPISKTKRWRIASVLDKVGAKK